MVFNIHQRKKPELEINFLEHIAPLFNNKVDNKFAEKEAFMPFALKNLKLETNELILEIFKLEINQIRE